MTALQKAKLAQVDGTDKVSAEVAVQFNPATLKLQRSNSVDAGKSRGRQVQQYNGTSSTTLTLELDKAGFAVASGSACSASSEHPSHVLAAMGALTHGNVRIGLTWTTAASETSQFLTELPPIVARIRATVGAS